MLEHNVSHQTDNCAGQYRAANKLQNVTESRKFHLNRAACVIKDFHEFSKKEKVVMQGGTKIRKKEIRRGDDTFDNLDFNHSIYEIRDFGRNRRVQDYSSGWVFYEFIYVYTIKFYSAMIYLKNQQLFHCQTIKDKISRT